MRRKEVVINGKRYKSLSQASKELNVEYQKLQKLFLSGATEVEINVEKLRHRYTNARPILYPEHLENIDFSKRHTLNEVAEHLYKLGLTDTITTQPNIMQIEHQALIKIAKILKDDILFKEIFGDEK